MGPAPTLLHEERSGQRGGRGWRGVACPAMALLPPDVRARFSPAGVYLDTPTVGLPSRATLDAMQADLDAWGAGTLTPLAYDDVVARCRQLWAGLVGAPPSWVAVAAQVSPLVGLVAAAVPRSWAPSRTSPRCCSRSWPRPIGACGSAPSVLEVVGGLARPA